MENQKNYLQDELNNGRKIKTLLMSHNAFWTPVIILRDKYENYHVDIHGGNLSYLNNLSTTDKEYDFIILFSSDYYDDETYLKLKTMAKSISKKENKRVSIGYSYMIPFEQRKKKELSEQIKIISIKNDVETEEAIYPPIPQLFTITELIEMTLISHDTLENQHVKKLVNNKLNPANNN